MQHKSLKDYWIDKSSFSRVTYDRNTLAEVIFQARFGRVLKVDADLPVKFQEAISSTHPILEVEEGIQINLGVAQAGAAVQTKTYKFFSATRSEFISLNSSFVAFTTQKYTTWEQFRAVAESALRALQDVYGIDTFLRLGLRYLNVIDRGTLGVSNEPWNSLLSSSALAWVADEHCEKWAKSCQTDAVYHCDPVTCHIRSGLISAENNPQSVAFLLDADYYVESTRTGDAPKILGQVDELNSYSGPFFRWCITPKLHALLGPRPVE